MYIDELLIAADFSKETNFKEQLLNKLNMIFSDGELDDDEAADIVAARGNAECVMRNAQLKPGN